MHNPRLSPTSVSTRADQDLVSFDRKYAFNLVVVQKLYLAKNYSFSSFRSLSAREPRMKSNLARTTPCREEGFREREGRLLSLRYVTI